MPATGPLERPADPLRPAARKILRRADWRFLLPSPAGGVFDHLVLLGGPDELADRLLEQGIVRRLSRRPDRSAAADAVVALADAGVPIEAAAACVGPTGALYFEVDRRAAGNLALTPRAMEARLRRAGLRPTGSYWVKPGFRRCEMYLPLDRPGALAWYLRSLYVAATPALELLGAAVRVLGADRFARLVPCYAVTAAGVAAPGRQPWLLGEPALTEALGQRELRALVLAGGEDEFSRVAVLPFGRDDAAPRLVLKGARLPARNEHTEREQVVQSGLWASLGDDLRDTIPRPLGVLSWGGVSIGVESCAPGRVLSSSVGRWAAPLRRKVADLRLAADWLTRFHRQTETERRSADLSMLDDYEATFRPVAEEGRLFAAARARAAALAHHRLPLVCQHYGFGEWNVYRQGNRLTVIDWEGGDPGLPLADLLFFAVQWHHTVRRLRGRDQQLAGFGCLFAGPPRDAVDRAVHQVVESYLDGLAIQRGFLPVLLVLTWVQRALYHHRGRAGVYGHADDARARNRWVEHVGVLASATERLFGEPSAA